MIPAPVARPADAAEVHTVVELWSELHAASVIGVSGQSMSRWRKAGVGPPYLRLGRKVLYRPADVTAWIDSQVQHPIPAVP